jgi:hypothetical protein
MRLIRSPRLLLLFWIPLLVDVVLPNSHASRFVTGLIASFPVSVFVWLAVEQMPALFKVRRYS